MLRVKYFLGVITVGLVFNSAIAQQAEVEWQYNENSVDPIPKYERLFKVRVWRNIDLLEKQNKGFFAKGGEITALIINAVKSGELSDVYVNDSLTTKMSREEFLEQLVQFEGQEFEAWDPDLEYYEGDQVSYGGQVYTSLYDNLGAVPPNSPDDWELNPGAGAAIEYQPRQVSLLRYMEDIIFDKRRSRLFHRPQSIQLIIPGTETANNLQKYIGVFKYKDLVQLFRNHPDEAMWVNRYNGAENKNYEDAFTLRLFRGSLFKFENPDDDAIADMYSTRQEAVMASEWWEMQLMEKEHNLWEF